MGNSINIGHKKYRVVEQIGEGGFSYVYHVRDHSNDYALKVILLQSQEQVDNAREEITVHEALRESPHILHLIQSEIVPSKKIKDAFELLMLFPLFTMGTLQGLIDKFNTEGQTWSEIEILMLFHDICLGVRDVHSKGWAHRDIKPANILICQESTQCHGRLHPSIVPILMDMGSTTQAIVSINSRQEALRLFETASIYSSASYRAPELHDIPREITIDSKTDVFSLGCTLYAMAFGSNPFENSVEGFSKLQLLSGDAHFPEVIISRGEKYSLELKDLILSMLCPQPSDRLDLDGVFSRIRYLINHPNERTYETEAKEETVPKHMTTKLQKKNSPQDLHTQEISWAKEIDWESDALLSEKKTKDSQSNSNPGLTKKHSIDWEADFGDFQSAASSNANTGNL